MLLWACAKSGAIQQPTQSMHYFIAATLLIVGIIHLLPAIGVLSAARISALYGIAVPEPNLELLLRHRAVLFALLGGFFVFAAFQPRYQAAAFVAGLVSVVSFLVLVFRVGGINRQLSRVVIADVLASLLLLAGASAFVWSDSNGG
jgi:hypothetical protein